MVNVGMYLGLLLILDQIMLIIRQDDRIDKRKISYQFNCLKKMLPHHSSWPDTNANIRFTFYINQYINTRHLFSFISDHDYIVNVPIHITLAKAVELDLIITIDIHPETILSVEVERAIGAVSVVPGALETDAQETLRKIDSDIDLFY